MKLETALKKAREGNFEFIDDIHPGTNRVRYLGSDDKFHIKLIEIEYPKVKAQKEMKKMLR